MSVWTALAGRLLDLPPPRSRVERSTCWVGVGDGARLSTTLYRPRQLEHRATVFVRTVVPAQDSRRPMALLAQLLAEQGHRVVVQECRGVQSSEGDFEPFVNDGRDGADTLDWLEAQPGAGGPLVLLGFGYGGHAAWATLAATRRPVEGLVVGFAARDPYAWLHPGGAFELENGFDMALGLAGCEREGIRANDLPRALCFRPLREADRVAARRIDWLRSWLDHPDPDGYWEERTPALPERPPATLLVGGWYHPALRAMQEDYCALAATARGAGLAAPRLLVGPWASALQPRRQRERGARLGREVACALVDHLDGIVGDASRAAPPVRFFVGGDGWRDVAEWPPTEHEQVLYLAGAGRAPQGGSLSADPPSQDAPADTYVYDPADAVRSEGGASPSRPGPIAIEGEGGRGDVLRYLSEPLPQPCALAGPARVSLFVSSDATRTDFTARLVRVDAGGTAFHLSDGIARVRLADGAPSRVEIELAAASRRLCAGERLRLDVSSSSFPRFDRHSNTAAAPAEVDDEACAPARQAVHHDARHPSCVRFRVLG